MGAALAVGAAVGDVAAVAVGAALAGGAALAVDAGLTWRGSGSLDEPSGSATVRPPSPEAALGVGADATVEETAFRPTPLAQAERVDPTNDKSPAQSQARRDVRAAVTGRTLAEPDEG